MDIAQFADLLSAAKAQPEPQRLLFVFVAGQFLEGFVLTPLVVGDKIGLSALAVIFALAFFGAIFGLVGVFLALPLAAIFKVAYVHAFAHYEQSRYYRQGE